MLRHRNIDRICCVVLTATLLMTMGLVDLAGAGVIAQSRTLGYEMRLFDQSRVHTIDIVMDDWEAFIDTCAMEEYSPCTVIIDGERFGNVAIRGKGNTSLSSVAQYGNDRYSFKIEFDQYQSGRTYHGLDKLSLNNLIQDKTWMKDYTAYTLMNKMGVAAPLCSFVQIRVNGEDWGFYLAVEAVEDSFLSRNYGADHGELYKPDSMSFGGGRGNGRDFDMEAFAEAFNSEAASENTASGDDTAAVQRGFDRAQMGGMQKPEGFDPAQMGGMQKPEGFASDFRGGFDRDGRGSSDVKLQYVDDDPASYSNIFNNAKTDITEADQARLIASLKTLSEGESVASVVDVEAVIRYFVVHNFLCNDDSYTGQMIHNYYLYEEDGVMSMIPWDYNLAFGGFSMGGFGGSGATSTVNTPIDSLVSSGDISSRPMAAWIFGNEEYTALYHEIYSEFMATVFESGWFETEMSRVIALIDPCVQADENGFFTYDEFLTGSKALLEFCALRAQSIRGQLDGAIPATTEAQRISSAALIDASRIDLSDMGEFGMGGGKGGFGPSGMTGDMPEDFDPASMQTPAGFDPGQMGGQAPAGFDPGQMGGQAPAGFDPGQMGGQAPAGFDPGQMGGQAPTGFDPAQTGETPADAEPSDAPETDTVPQNEAEGVAAKDTPSSDEISGPEGTTADDTAAASADGEDALRNRGGMPVDFTDMSAQPQGSQGENAALLVASAMVLVIAIVFAKRFKGMM